MLLVYVALAKAPFPYFQWVFLIQGLGFGESFLGMLLLWVPMACTLILLWPRPLNPTPHTLKPKPLLLPSLEVVDGGTPRSEQGWFSNLNSSTPKSSVTLQAKEANSPKPPNPNPHNP